MQGLWRPVIVLVCVSGAVFALSQGALLAPAKPASGAASIPLGDPARGAKVFAATCAGCHGDAGAGGAGPMLAGTGLSAALVQERIDDGAGIMPARLVQGSDEADVLAYVVRISAAK